MGLRAPLPNHIPACRSELKLSILKSFSIVETVKEASAVCRSFLDRVLIFSQQVDQQVERQMLQHFEQQVLRIFFAVLFQT